MIIFLVFPISQLIAASYCGVLRSVGAPPLKSLLRTQLPWDSLLCVRGWLRMRTGPSPLRSLHGRRSRALVQQCIFCSAASRNPQVHVLGVCTHWSIKIQLLTLSRCGSYAAVHGQEPLARRFSLAPLWTKRLQLFGVADLSYCTLGGLYFAQQNAKQTNKQCLV